MSLGLVRCHSVVYSLPLLIKFPMDSYSIDTASPDTPASSIQLTVQYTEMFQYPASSHKPRVQPST